jgi:glycosyltransferase involved in cell wall biosynthesis
MTLVSVVMPTFNAARWVTNAIDTVSAQTYSELELIAVDDHSQDDTVAVLRNKLASDFRRPWQVIELPANQGPSAARNVGLHAAKGSWVQFLDSDDSIAPNKFELQMAHCHDASPEIVSVYSPFRRCYVDDGEVTWEGPIDCGNMQGRLPVMCLIGGYRPLHSSGLTRRSILERIGGFDETLRFWECEEINVRIAAAGSILHIPSSEPLYRWRMHRQSYIGGDKARYRAVPVALGWIEQVLKAGGHQSLDELGLTKPEREAVLNDCTMWARLLFGTDRAAFRRFIAMARALDPDITPTNPVHIAWLAKRSSYETSETVAKLLRIPRRLARKTLVGLRLRRQTALIDYD